MRKARRSAVFDDIFYFNLDPQTVEDMQVSQLTVKVFDADLVTRSELIGSFTVDLLNIYFRPHHEIHRQWVGLVDSRNPEDHGVQVTPHMWTHSLLHSLLHSFTPSLLICGLILSTTACVRACRDTFASPAACWAPATGRTYTRLLLRSRRQWTSKGRRVGRRLHWRLWGVAWRKEEE